MHLQQPLFLILLVPACWGYWRWAWRSGVRNALRLGLLAVLGLLAAGPVATTPGLGHTLLLVIDRSQSMPASAEHVRSQLVRRAVAEAGPSHVLAVVGFGAEPVVERYADPDQPPESAVRRMDPNQSNLYRAISAALHLAPEWRPCRMLVLSDGLAGDRMTPALATELKRRAVPVDVLATQRPTAGDVRMRAVHGPSRVPAGSEMAFEFDIVSPESTTGTLRVLRDERQIVAIPIAAAAGASRATWRGKADFVGMSHFRFELEVPRDPAAENNTWSCWVDSQGPPVVLVVQAAGAETALPAWLREAGFHVERAVATGAPLPPARLAGAAAVVLDNVSTEDLGQPMVEQLTRYVRQLDGGLVLTGGPRAYLAGGYSTSPLEPLLPVRLRGVPGSSRPAIAVVVLLALSRGELVGTVGDTGTRALQNAIRGLTRTLTPQDAIALVDLDFDSPVALPLTSPSQISQLQDAVNEIGPTNEPTSTERSLFAAFDLLQSAAQPNRHLLIVADVAQTSAFASVPDIARRIRVPVGSTSIVTWGQRADPTLAGQLSALYPGLRLAATDELDRLGGLLLDDLAFRTGSGIVKRETAVQVAGSVGPGPRIASFHAAELREGAVATLMAADDPKSTPLGARQAQRRGRVASLLFAMPATSSAADPLAASVIEQVRWVAGRNDRDGKLVVTAEVSGRTAVIQVRAGEWGGAGPADSLSLEIESLDGSADSRAVTFEHVGEDLRAQVDIDGMEPRVALVCRGAQVWWRSAPLAAARAPEFLDDRSAADGRAELLELARQTGGREIAAADRLFEPTPSVTRSRARPFAWLGLILLLLDVAERRLGLRVPTHGWSARAAPAVEPAARPAPGGPDAYERAKERSRRRMGRG